MIERETKKKNYKTESEVGSISRKTVKEVKIPREKKKVKSTGNSRRKLQVIQRDLSDRG